MSMQISIFRPRAKEHVLRVRARMEGDSGELGDFMEHIRPGETFLGWSYAELLAMGDGMHDIQPRPARLRLWPGESEN